MPLRKANGYGLRALTACRRSGRTAVRMLPWHALSVVIAGHSPSRLKPERYSVRFVFRHNASGDTIVVDNMHFEGIGRFSARSPEYACFVRGALSFAHAARPDAKYRGGTGMVSYGAQAGLAAGTLLLVAYAIMTFGLGGWSSGSSWH